MTHVAIIGAGMAGLAAARWLQHRRPALTLTLYEQQHVPGGRVATGRREGCAFDHGAQYVKTPTPALEQLLTAELPTAALIDIGRPVWIFDRAGAIAPGDPAQNAGPKWTYRDGLDRLGTLMAAGLDIRRGVGICALRRAAGEHHRALAYELCDRDGRPTGAPAGCVLFTPPAPQVVAILAASDLDMGVKDSLIEELGKVTYRPCLSLALAYDRRIVRPFYALVNTDRAHPIAWLACEHDKGPQRCPPGQSLLVVQLAPQISRDCWGLSAEELVPIVAGQVSTLLGEDLRHPLWGDLWRWRYALPDVGADVATLNRIGSAAGLFFAGDYTAGQGRVHLAIESGWRAAEAIAAALPATRCA